MAIARLPYQVDYCRGCLYISHLISGCKWAIKVFSGFDSELGTVLFLASSPRGSHLYNMCNTYGCDWAWWPCTCTSILWKWAWLTVLLCIYTSEKAQSHCGFLPTSQSHHGILLKSQGHEGFSSVVTRSQLYLGSTNCEPNRSRKYGSDYPLLFIAQSIYMYMLCVGTLFKCNVLYNKCP